MSGWAGSTGSEAENLERDLARELPGGHVLTSMNVRAVARRFLRSGRQLFELDDGRRCVVHLTWNVESDPRWPSCLFVSDFPGDEE